MSASPDADPRVSYPQDGAVAATRTPRVVRAIQRTASDPVSFVATSVATGLLGAVIAHAIDLAGR